MPEMLGEMDESCAPSGCRACSVSEARGPSFLRGVQFVFCGAKFSKLYISSASERALQYSVEPITREGKTSGLTESTIDRTLFQMMFGDIPMPLDGKLPHWAVVESIVCVMPGCSTNVHVKGFTVIVNGSIFGTLDTSLTYQCPHKNCLVSIGCVKLSVTTGGDRCPSCQCAMTLVDRK